MWQTHITVAAVIEYKEQFLLVSDKTSNGIKLNQPAGHLEKNESLTDAVIREVKEETSLDFIPQKIIGIYLYEPNPENTYLRICFSGELQDYNKTTMPSAADHDVVAANWYFLKEIKARKEEHRSTLVMRSIEDYLLGKEFPLDILSNNIN